MKSTHVRRILETAAPVHGERVVAFVAPGRGEVAFVVGRRVGGAVARNRARRIMRAAWREVARRVPGGYDVVWVARASIRGAKTQDVVPEMERVLRHARVMEP